MKQRIHFGAATLFNVVMLAAVLLGGGILAPDAAAQSPGAKPDLKGTIVFQTASGDPIYAINADTLKGTGGTHLRYLTTGMDPVLSPDGQWVAFTRWNNGQNGALGDVRVINIDGSGERAILGDVHQPKSPTWSPDSQQIVINMQQGGWLDTISKCVGFKRGHRPTLPPNAYDIHVSVDEEGDLSLCFKLDPNPFWGLRLIDVASGSFKDLPRDTHSFSPTWDPADASRLVYDGDMGLVNLDLASGTTRALTADVADHSPVFSPDGSKIAVAYQQAGHWEIHVLNADGSGRVRLTETPLRVIAEQEIKGEAPHSWNNTAPAWSPDGSQIAFLTDRTGRWEIWVMNADGSNQRPMFSDAVNDQLQTTYNSVDERVLSWR